MTTQCANELTPAQACPMQNFATPAAEVRAYIKAIPGYRYASIVAFANERQYSRYAPKGHATQTVTAYVKDQWGKGCVERYFAVTV